MHDPGPQRMLVGVQPTRYLHPIVDDLKAGSLTPQSKKRILSIESHSKWRMPLVATGPPYLADKHAPVLVERTEADKPRGMTQVDRYAVLEHTENPINPIAIGLDWSSRAFARVCARRSTWRRSIAGLSHAPYWLDGKTRHGALPTSHYGAPSILQSHRGVGVDNPSERSLDERGILW